jgi:circadian clock protein KaiC
MATGINQVKRLRTWIEGFDPLVDGGIPRPSFVLLAGHPGTGKSTFGLQFLLNRLIHDNELGVYASFLETQEVFVRNMSSNYGFDLVTCVP